VLQGLFFGNLTLALVLPIALAWRYRDVPIVAGVSTGLAVAAKLFAWPLVIWLLLTRRFRAGGTALASAGALVLLPWAVIGFEGFGEYPSLLDAVNDVYSRVSLSTSAVAASFGIPTAGATALSLCLGLALLCLAAWLARRDDGDRRSFAAAIGACVLAAPIVWQNYLTLLFVPIAVTWPRIAIPWFFGYAVWLAALLPKPTATVPEPCCKPADVPDAIWQHSHAQPSWGHAGGTMTAAALVVLWLLVARRARAGASLVASEPGPAAVGLQFAAPRHG
jgi:hypothetical protein